MYNINENYWSDFKLFLFSISDINRIHEEKKFASETLN